MGYESNFQEHANEFLKEGMEGLVESMLTSVLVSQGIPAQQAQTLGTLLGTGCVIAFLYGFFLSFASGVPAFFERRPAKKYAGQTLLVFRTLTAKLATMGIVMATVSLLFTATLIVEGSGMTFRAMF